MHEPHLTVIGNVAGPPRSRVTPQGVHVADFRIAATPRRLDRHAGAWNDGETLWFGVTVWRSLADHCASSLGKGDRVVVTGRLTTRSWEVEGGERRSGLEIEATSVGLELSRAAAAYVRPGVLVPHEDPWVSSGLVDQQTGEVLPGEPGGARDPEVAEADEQAA